MKEQELRVWWISQVGAADRLFYVSVKTVMEGKKVLDILSAYDAYQLQNRIKPDYCNAGGLEMWNDKEKEWRDWYLETEDDFFEDLDDYCERCDQKTKNELYEFSSNVFEQIDWNKIEEITK